MGDYVKVNKNYIVICNVNIHKKTKLSRTKFLERVKNVKEIRCWEDESFASYYITSDSEFKNLKVFYDLVNEGVFPDKSNFRTIFAIAINPNLYDWFKNNSFHVIERQVIFWMASIYFFDPDKRKNVFDVQFYPPVIDEIKSILENVYTQLAPLNSQREDEIISTYDLNKSKFIFNPRELYYKGSVKYLGKEPPEFLSNPFGFSTKNRNWGINKFSFKIIIAYFTKNDWDDIIVKGDDEALIRAESEKGLWNKWKHTFSMYEISNKKTYSFFLSGDSNLPLKLQKKSSKNSGFVYLMRNPTFEKNIFKVGLTRKNTIERAKGLSNTSVPGKFHVLCDWHVFDCVLAEKRIKSALAKFIVDPKREFFKVDIKTALELINNELNKLENEKH